MGRPEEAMMKRLARFGLFTRSRSACVFALTLAACGGGTDAVSDAGPIHPEIDAVFADLDRDDGPGAAVGVLLDGEVVHRAGYGLANMDHAIPITPETVFDIASISKQFGALAALLLAEEGALDLDADVRDYVPEVPDFGYTITPRHLIHHTSGIRDWPHAMLLGGMTYTDVISFEKILRMLYQQEDLDFPPGEEYSYSNTGYNLLARIIEVQSGQTFRAYTEDRIFRPLGMRTSHFSDNYLEVVPDRAESYAPSDNGHVRVVNQLTALASSSLHTTIDDFLLWMQNYESAEVGGPLIERMLERGVLNDGEELNYAHGLSYNSYRGLDGFGHGGSWAGYRTNFLRIPEHNLSIVVFCNVSDCNPAGRARDVAAVLLSDHLGPEPQSTGGAAPTPEPVELTESELREYEGSYRSSELDSTYELVVTDGALVAHHWRNDSANLTPMGNDLFEGDTQWFPRVNFTRNERGQVSGFLASGSRVRNVYFQRR